MKINVQLQPDADLQAQLANVTGPKARTRLHEHMGLTVKERTVDHLTELAGSRHTTATRLGATPTGHLEQAARAVENAPLSADAESASFVIHHIGMSRAFQDVTILPKQQFLTIPLNRLAYGRRCGEFGKGQVVFNPDPTKPMPEGVAAYALVRSVTQKQDRSLLPSDAEWEAAAEQGARNYFNAEISS